MIEETIPNAGKASIYTSGCPKNQKICWNKTGSPPPAALKKLVPKYLSVRSIVTAPAKTGNEAINKNEVITCESQKNLKILDLTGAGDLFAAGFLHGHINKMSLKESLVKGTEMASKIIQQIGARLN